MNVRNLVAGLALCGVAAVYAALIAGIPDRTLPNTPGPTFMPWLIAVAMAMLSLALVGQALYALLRRAALASNAIPTNFDLRSGLLLVAFAVYLAVLPYCGFLYSSIAFFGALMMLFGARRPVVIAVASVAVPLSLQLLFRHAFSVVLPAGTF